MESDDPRDVEVVVVHADDVLAALAATAQGRETVLRVTPPFRSRQRARIHVPGDEGVPGSEGPDETATSDVDPLLVPAAAFVDDDAPSFPRAADTEPAPADSSAYDVDDHYERHQAAVDEWRSAVREHLREAVTVDSGRGASTVEVRYLGE